MLQKIPVGILGATGLVGQKMISLLAYHPWFCITCLAASKHSAYQPYGQVTSWRMSSPLPNYIHSMPIRPCHGELPCSLLFSALKSQIAGPIEQLFAQRGYTIVSNCSYHRMQTTVPLLIPEVNPSHLSLVSSQTFEGGIITNPNCSVIGLAIALKPLIDCWGIEKVQVTTLQALSGAGYPGVASIDIIDNVIPFITSEEEKIETEPLKIFGKLSNNEIRLHTMQISAQCTRVPVSEGHLACVSVKLKKPATKQQILSSWTSFQGCPEQKKLPSAPAHPIIYLSDETHPQPNKHRYLGQGMTVSIGRLRSCPILDWKFVILSHNTLRGAAGSAVMNAEYLVTKNLLTDKKNCPNIF
jgi:aspartate-semialdehyde dehydrogenase